MGEGGKQHRRGGTLGDGCGAFWALEAVFAPVASRRPMHNSDLPPPSTFSMCLLVLYVKQSAKKATYPSLRR